MFVHQLEDGKIRFEHPAGKFALSRQWLRAFPDAFLVIEKQPDGWMQRLKDQGLDPTKPEFLAITSSSSSANPGKAQAQEIQMTKPGVDRKISIAELNSAQAKEEAWFVVQGEVSSHEPSASISQHHPD